MTPQGNGQPIPYHVSMSGLTRNRLRELHRQEAEAGRGSMPHSGIPRVSRALRSLSVDLPAVGIVLPISSCSFAKALVRPLVVIRGS